MKTYRFDIQAPYYLNGCLSIPHGYIVETQADSMGEAVEAMEHAIKNVDLFADMRIVDVCEKTEEIAQELAIYDAMIIRYDINGNEIE